MKKKILALVLAFALCFTAVAGCITTSADAPTLSIEVNEVASNGGATSFKVSGTDYGTVAAQQLKVTIAKNVTLNSIFDGETPLVAATDNAGADADYYVTVGENETVVNIVSVFNIGSVNRDSFSFTFNVTVPANDGETDATYNVKADVTAGDIDENYVIIESASADITVKAPVVEDTCDHDPSKVTSVVTTQPTKDALGVMTYTCECGETWTGDIDKPAKLDTTFLQLNLFVDKTVGNRIYVNYSATGGLTLNGYSDYILNVDYEKYGSGYASMAPDTKVFTKEIKDPTDSSSKAHCFKFSEIALYEMPLEYTLTLYLKDANGLVVAYTEETTSIAKQALAYAKEKHSKGGEQNLIILKSVVDMVRFGASVQEFFGNQNKGSLIDGAVLPNVVFEIFEGYESSIEELPAEFNTTSTPVKDLATTTLAVEPKVITQASNFIRYSILTTGYEASKLEGAVSYTNAYGTVIPGTVDFEALTPTITSKGKVIYTYDFLDLALYDLDATVTLRLSYNDVQEYSYLYSAEAYIASKINDATYRDVFSKMVLFSRSTKVAFLYGK